MSDEARLSRNHTLDPSKTLAFTMAEILLSLTIIGVVAAITLPSLMANINERTWNTQRKALYARLSQAIAMMPQLNGYGTLTEDENGSVTVDTAAETFLTEGLSKVLKINNICDKTHLADCGVPTSYVNFVGSTMSWPVDLKMLNSKLNLSISEAEDGSVTSCSFYNTKAAAFETQNGESIAIYYNPNCLDNSGDNVKPTHNFVIPWVCANFVYDLNGNKGPNTVGKDVGHITALYPSNPVMVAPMLISTAVVGTAAHADAGTLCLKSYPESRIPNLEEAVAIFYNRKLYGFSDQGGFWTSSVVDSTRARYFHQAIGRYYLRDKTSEEDVRCITR